MPYTLHHRARRFVALLFALLVVPLAWSQEPLEVREQNGITFVSGGFGQDERDRLQAMRGRFNLKLVFALDTGNYLAGIDVRIVDQHDKALVETGSSGPILMAHLPEGTYTVVADNAGDRKQQSVNLGGRGMTEVVITWPAG